MKSGLKFISILYLVLYAASIAACNVNQEFDIYRDFTPTDLLISIADMPSSWSVERESGVYNAGDYYHAKEGAVIVFVADLEIRHSSAHDVYRYVNQRQAQKYFEEIFLLSPIGSGEFTPQEWTSPDTFADEAAFSCTWSRVRGDQQEHMHCEWVGRYEEYVVSFSTWILPEMISIDEMTNLIIKINAIMVENLDK